MISLPNMPGQKNLIPLHDRPSHVEKRKYDMQLCKERSKVSLKTIVKKKLSYRQKDRFRFFFFFFFFFFVNPVI